MLDASGTRHLMLAETLGLAMARRAAEILERHRAAWAGDGAAAGGSVVGNTVAGSTAVGNTAVGPRDDDAQFALDNAVFTAVLDAVSECLGRFDTRPAEDRWCDALFQVILLASCPSGVTPVSANP